MKTGDFVTGKTIEIEEFDLPDTVTGYLEVVPVKVLDEAFNTILVFVEDSDGDQIPVECEEDSIKAAGRREKVTVLS